MNEMQYREQFNELMARIVDLPPELRGDLNQWVDETETRHRLIRAKGSNSAVSLPGVEIVTKAVTPASPVDSTQAQEIA